MKKVPLYKRLLSTVLVVAMLFTLLVPVVNAEEGTKAASTEELELIPIDAGTLESRKLDKAPDDTIEADDHKLTDVVRVSVELEKDSTIGAGFSTKGIADNAQAKAYRESLKADQAAMTAKIEAAIGGKLDVKWNLTLAANMISANVKYGDIAKIEAIDGVKRVILENRYEPQQDADVTEDDIKPLPGKVSSFDQPEASVVADEPNNGSASHMIGSNYAWAAGYTGAGSKVAVIDTGIDKDHQSFSGEGLEYALTKIAEEKGITYDEYAASLNLMTAEKIDAVKDQLNANVSGEQAYVSTKIPYAYNYVDSNYDVTHENDTQGEHGSHVEGISAANRFIKVDGEYQPALEAVGTQGVAPDAQIVSMKVFGTGGGAYDSDYMSAIEDAIILGCDSANLSLGSGVTGHGFSDGYEEVMNKLVNSDMVCSFSAGNSGMWYDSPMNEDMYPYIYMDDNNFATGGSPGSFTNSLTVASVDNLGQTGMPLLFGDRNVFYTETSGYGNSPMTSLANDEGYEYVLVDGAGVDDNDHVGAEGDQFLALGKEVLEGKVALCYRGSSSFFAKANAAMAQGAVGIIIINNTDGTISMNLTGYEYTAPAVSILKADGDAIKAESEAVTDPETGDVLYYTGTMSISDELQVLIPEITDDVTVSSFSSFGVPGTLVMKPEILAPGGNIYSVNGLNQGDSGMSGGHDQYELMSGTSMAAPQVNGMAGVMGQYIRETGLAEKTGLTARQLTNSLLMSTAHPVYDEYGEYWPIIRVGAGLGNVGDAISAKSYILMDEASTLFPDTAKDGKVKAELGDDPERTGEYEFSFTVYPLNETKTFSLDTDIFVQDIAGDAGYGMLQYSGSVDLDTLVASAFGMDELQSYDVLYQIGDDVYEGGEEVEISEPTQVTVYISLNDYAKMVLDYYYEGGAYIQGYTFLDPADTEEGAPDDVIHSIPILAYYGSWTDASMFDRDSVVDNAYGTGKLPYTGNSNTNYLTLRNSAGETSIYMGNPYIIEETFPEDRLAMSSETTLYQANYLPIRNIGTSGAAVTDEEGNVLWASGLQGSRYSAYYYVNGDTWQNTSPVNFTINKKLGTTGVKEDDIITVGFYALPEYYAIANAKTNDEVATSGNLDAEGFKNVLESGIVGDGAAIKYTVKVDDTAPVVDGALRDLISGDLSVKASDNNYIAYVAVLNRSGSKVFAECVPEQTEPNQTVTVPLDLNGQTLPDTVVLLVADYAGNETAYEVNLGGDQEDLGGKILGFTSTDKAPGSGNRVLELDPDTLYYNRTSGEYTGLSVFAAAPTAVRAAEYVDGYVYMASTDGYIYAAKLNALDEAEAVGSYTDLTSTIYDMAFNYADGKLYAMGVGNILFTIDLITGELTPVAQVQISHPTSSTSSYQQLVTLAIDDEGNFYSVNYGSTSNSFLFKYTLDDLVLAERDVNLDGETNEADAQAILDKVTGKLAADAAFDEKAADVDEDTSITSADAYLLLVRKTEPIQAVNPARNGAVGAYSMGRGGSMAWDHNTGKLYLAGNYSATYDYDHVLFVVDPVTGKGTRTNTTNTRDNASFNLCLNGLFITPTGSSLVQPTDEAIRLEVEPEELNILKGQTVECSAKVFPWTLTDKDVTWASGDETIAVVTETGIVTGVGAGETVITVTTSAEPHLVAEIPITVTEAPDAEIRGIIWDEEGKGQASVFHSNATNDWQGLATVGSLTWAALVDDTLYGSTDDTMYAVDADTYEVTTLGGIVSDWIPSDAAGLPADLPEAWGITGRVAGLCNNGGYFEVLNPEAGNLNYWDLTSAYASDPMAVIAYVGRLDYVDSYGDEHPNSAMYYMMTESGELWAFFLDLEGYLIREDYGPTGLDLTGVSDVTNEVWGSMVYDEEAEFLYVSLYNGQEDVANLYAIDANDPSCNAILGDFNESVWPVVGLYQYEPATDLVLKVNPTELALYEGETAELNIKVKLGETNEYTVESADPAVATVDETGLITAVKEGQTEITVTTVDTNEAGEKLSETVNVTVKSYVSLDSSLIAQVTDENGTNFVRLNLNNLSNSKLAEAPGNVTSGARTGDIYMAGMGTRITAVDAEDLTTPADYSFDSFYAQYPAQDIANYPNFLDEEGELDENKALFTTSLGWLVTPDYYGWNLSTDLPDMAGICFAGTDEDEEGTPIFVYYLLTTGGILYELDVDYTAGSISYQARLDTGITLADQSDASLAFIHDVKLNPDYTVSTKNMGIVIADNGTKKLWYVDFTTGEVGQFGTVDCTNISGLVGTFDALDSVAGEIVVEPDPYDEADTVKSFGFETNPTADGWIFTDADNDGYNWIWSNGNSNIYHYEGDSCIYSQSYAGGVGPLTPNNWAISPAIDLSDVTDPVLSVFARGQDPSYAEEVFALYAGTSPDPASMTKVSEDYTATGKYTRYTADLSNFAGEAQVYVAIRHYNVSDMYYLNVDQVEVLTNVPENAPAIVEKAYNPAEFAAVDCYHIGDGVAAADQAAAMDAVIEMTAFDPEKPAEAVKPEKGQAAELQAAEGAAEGGEVTVTLTEKAATTNGMMLVSYDPAVLTFVSASSEIQLNSVNAADGKVSFAYASAAAVAANSPLAELKFSYTGDYVNTVVSVNTYERGADVAVREEPVIIPLEQEDGEHNWVEDTEARVEPTCTETGLATYKCSKCGEVKVETLDALGHTWDEGTVTTEPTCTDAGVKTFTCTVCQETRTEAVDAKGHTPEDVAEVPATCTEAGTTAGKKCSVCGAILEGIETILPTGHTVVTDEAVAPTCTEDGKTAGAHCSVCNEILVAQEIVKATGHKAEVLPAVEATCTETGLTEGSRCSVCGEILTAQEVVAAKGHTPEDVAEVPATCTETGTTAGKKCSVCGEILEGIETIPATDHTVEVDPAVAATCTEDGLTAGAHCAVCNKVLVAQEVVKAAGHTVVTDKAVAATCTEAGLTEGSHCSVCGEILVAQQTVEALGHRWDNGVTTVAPDCTNAGIYTYTCRRCNETRVEAIDAKGHTPVNVAAVAATCTEAGTTAGKKCSVCGAILEGIEPVPATGHTLVMSEAVAATCTNAGKTAGVSCSVCGKELIASKSLAALGHKWSEGLVTKAPTASEAGEMTYLCTQCGEKKTEAIAKLKGADLELAIKTAQAVDTDKFTEASLAALDEALAAAEEALKYATTQEALDAAKDALAQALQDLAELPAFLFDDVKDESAFYFDPVYWAYYHEPQITNGTDETHFSPDEGVTRGQAVTFLWRANGEPKADNAVNPFVDVAEDDYYYNAVLWAVEKGITNGTDETHFSPDDVCQREHIITFVWRFWDKPEAKGTDNPFKDVSAEDYYYTAALWAVENGVADEATGTTADTFGGSETCTRGQCVTYLYRSSDE
jgi:lactocepin